MDKCYITNLIKDIEVYAKEENVPIMQREAIDFICDYIKNNNVKSVLEIGTAVGYSTILIANSGASVTSIERDRNRYEKAIENVKKASLEESINLIFKDAFDVFIDEKFDLILIDAAKAQNVRFIEKFKVNLKSQGIMIIDNVDFHGYVGNSDSIVSKNLKALVRKIEKFLDYLDNQDEFLVTKINKGDGLIILNKIREDENHE